MNNKVSFVMYHYVRDLINTRYPRIKGLDTSKFVEQLKYFKRNYNIISMEDVLSSIKSNNALPNKSLVLTFDDAYSDHYTNVFPILDDMGIQGSFYVPVKAVTQHVVLDVNKIHFILAATEAHKEILNDIRILLSVYKERYYLNEYDYYYKKLAIAGRFDTADVIFIKRILQIELQENVRSKIVNKLFEKYVGITDSVFSKELYMNTEQIIHMNRSGMHIGIHGYDHYSWDMLSDNELATEIDLSIEYMNRIGGDMNNLTVCYPYGVYNDKIINLLKKKRCRLAFTTEVGVAKLSDKTRFKLPRYDTNDM